MEAADATVAQSPPDVVAQAPSEIVAQAPAGTVLTGRVSNVDTITRDILRDEIKLEKYNLTYRLNAAKQGRWKGWRYFAIQECALGLVEGDLIAMTSYRGHGLHHPERVHRGTATNGTVLPAFIGFIVSGGGDAIELMINGYHYFEAHQNGFSQTQARLHVAELVNQIDKKIAERDAMLREQPSSDADVAQAQALEGKVLADFRQAALSEFQRFHIGASSTLANQQAFYLLDIAQTVTGAVWSALTMNLINKGKERMCQSSGIIFLVNAAQTMLDPMLAYGASRVAAKLDERSLRKSGFCQMMTNCGTMSANCSALKKWAVDRQNSGSPEVNALLSRVKAYDMDSAYHTAQIENYDKALRNQRKTAMMNTGWGLFIGGSKLPFGILPTIAGTKLIRGKVVNAYYFTGSTVLLPSISAAILDSWRSQIQGEITYQRLKRQNLLPNQIIHTRMAALDQIEAAL